jgi:hypothetical protein
MGAASATSPATLTRGSTPQPWPSRSPAWRRRTPVRSWSGLRRGLSQRERPDADERVAPRARQQHFAQQSGASDGVSDFSLACQISHTPSERAHICDIAVHLGSGEHLPGAIDPGGIRRSNEPGPESRGSGFVSHHAAVLAHPQ